MSLLPFVRGTTERRDGGVRSVLIDVRALGSVGGLFRLRFHTERLRKAWPCAVTGAAIPLGDVALVPHLRAFVGGPFLEPFRVSLEGWALLDPEARQRAT